MGLGEVGEHTLENINIYKYLSCPRIPHVFELFLQMYMLLQAFYICVLMWCDVDDENSVIPNTNNMRCDTHDVLDFST